MKDKTAWLFNEPVDPSKWGISDYFDVIKHPMDFGTIKVSDKKYFWVGGVFGDKFTLKKCFLCWKKMFLGGGEFFLPLFLF